ncbi:MAG: DUF3795 domain-containing protein [bacterium]|nr:DUF3795 domain-containing protein [bacterium]
MIDEKRVSPCGLVCEGCPAYVATQQGNIDAVAEVTAYWASEYAPELTADDVWCEGCHAEEGKPLYLYARTCAVRECVPERGVPNCAHCEEYQCDKLKKLLRTMPTARNMLKKLREGMGE